MRYKALLRSSGVVSGESDLWCTYAAVRTLRWLDRLGDLHSPETVIDFLRSRQNADGGYAWSPGMTSDAWATYYCTQATRDLRNNVESTPIHRPSDDWVWSTQGADGGFAMTPGQSSDVWATYYSVRTLVEIYGKRPPAALRDWLSRLQTEDGGLSWSPAHAKSGRADVRACYYAITAWTAATASGAAGALPWNRERLVGWLQDRQNVDGGFTFADGADTACMWATFRATNALRGLAEQPADRDACVAWIRGRLRAGGSFTRWPGYPVQDVWAAFCATGALRALGAGLADNTDIADQVAAAVLSFRITGGGFTYRVPHLASDVLTTSARTLSGDSGAAQQQDMRRWLESCMLPNEDGVMYMPGRGSEVRCTLWALCAGAFEHDPSARARIARWLTDAIQNPDGGFGYWEGRGSDMVSTAAAAEILRLTGGPPDAGALAGIAAFASSCRVLSGQYGNIPGGQPTLRATLQALRARRRTVDGGDQAVVAEALARHRVRSGGFANQGQRLPDLLSTYEATLAADLFGVDVAEEHLAAFLGSVRMADSGFAWTPLMKTSGGPLADCVGRLLEQRVLGHRPTLPPLTIS